LGFKALLRHVPDQLRIATLARECLARSAGWNDQSGAAVDERELEWGWRPLAELFEPSPPSRTSCGCAATCAMNTSALL
jgi:hypothetical protein